MASRRAALTSADDTDAVLNNAGTTLLQSSLHYRSIIIAHAKALNTSLTLNDFETEVFRSTTKKCFPF
jgi:hypothetical protein